MLKPQSLSEKKCLEKRQSTVEDIFKGIDVKNDAVYTEEYSSSEEALSLKLWRRKSFFKCKQLCSIKNYKRRHVLGNGNCLFASLDKLVFNDSFGLFQLRQLIVDHIKDNKDLYTEDMKVILMTT